MVVYYTFLADKAKSHGHAFATSMAMAVIDARRIKEMQLSQGKNKARQVQKKTRSIRKDKPVPLSITQLVYHHALKW